MTPAEFPESNATFKSPPDLPGSCAPIKGLICEAKGGIWDGSMQVVVAWKPSPQELQDLNEGGVIYLSVMGGLPPHFLCTRITEAIG